MLTHLTSLYGLSEDGALLLHYVQKKLALLAARTRTLFRFLGCVLLCFSVVYLF
jgi:hypothetical protein